MEFIFLCHRSIFLSLSIMPFILCFVLRICIDFAESLLQAVNDVFKEKSLPSSHRENTTSAGQSELCCILYCDIQYNQEKQPKHRHHCLKFWQQKPAPFNIHIERSEVFFLLHLIPFPLAPVIMHGEKTILHYLQFSHCRQGCSEQFDIACIPASILPVVHP